MKTIRKWVLAAALICGVTTVGLTSCKTVEKSASKVEANELIRTSQSWDGVELPDYLQGRPELVSVKYVIIGLDGKKKVVHEGEAVVEMVGTIHHGENLGKKDAILYMFYLSQKDLPLAVQHPEIPLE